MPARYVSRGADLDPGVSNKSKANTIRVDSDTDTLKFGTGTSGTTEKEAVDLSSTQTITGAKSFTADGARQFAEIALTNAEIKALRAAPKTLVAAPGAGKMLVFHGAELLLDYGSNALTETADNMAVRYTDGSGTIVSDTIEATGFIDQTADTKTNAVPVKDTISAKTACENKALVLHNTGDGEYGGNAGNDTLMRVKVFYSVVTTGW